MDGSDRPLEDVRVLLGVSGGIAAYKAALLARLLVGAGAVVDPVLTNGAQRFVGPATFEGITRRTARADVWDDIAADTHVAAGRAAQLAIVYPATAHTLAKLAHGLADDLLTTTLLAATCPLVLAPAMHTEMWQHPATRANAALLAERGAHLLGPADGALMGGDTGPGRLVEPDEAFALLLELHRGGSGRDLAGRSSGDLSGRGSGDLSGRGSGDLSGRGSGDLSGRGSGDLSGRGSGDLAGRRVLVTAAGTREPIDPVRFLGNRASGKMGFAVAAAAAQRGASVELVTGPTSLPTPPGVRRTDVTTALEMRDAVLGSVDGDPGLDVVVKAAAVADFRPGTVSGSKLKKHAGVPTIELVPNPDILAELGARPRDDRRPLLVGFAAETDDVEANGRDKLERKGADLLVVNDVGSDDAGFAVDTNRVVILGRDGGRTEVELTAKTEVAHRILDLVVASLGARS
jgi:phosphopantothenoylcysteine decarboxylase / phosphopantothenate---cysteine ligase